MFVVIGPYVFMDEFPFHLILKIDDTVNEFMKATNEEDELQIILRGQLYIEHEIEKMLRLYFVEPKVYFRNNPMFNSKLNLVVALGLLPKNKMKAYEKFNQLRNKFAHELRYKITEEKLNELVDSMDSELKGEIFYEEWNEDKPMSDEKRHLLKIKRTVLTLWVYVSKLVYKLIVGQYREKIQEVEARYTSSENTQSLEECEAECMEHFNEMKRELGITEEFFNELKSKSGVIEEVPIGS